MRFQGLGSGFLSNYYTLELFWFPIMATYTKIYIYMYIYIYIRIFILIYLFPESTPK